MSAAEQLILASRAPDVIKPDRARPLAKVGVGVREPAGEAELPANDLCVGSPPLIVGHGAPNTCICWTAIGPEYLDTAL